MLWNMASGPVGLYGQSADIRPPLKRKMAEFPILPKRTEVLFGGCRNGSCGQDENGD